MSGTKSTRMNAQMLLTISLILSGLVILVGSSLLLIFEPGQSVGVNPLSLVQSPEAVSSVVPTAGIALIVIGISFYILNVRNTKNFC